MKILGCVLLLFLSCSMSFAHSCASPFKNLPDKEYSQKLKEVDYIFEGEMVSLTFPRDDNCEYFITYKVSRVWKGDIKPEITIKFDNPCVTVCQKVNEPLNVPVKVSEAKKEIVYAYRVLKEDPFLRVNCCSVGSFDDLRMKREYGEGTAVEQPAQEIEQPSKEQTTAAAESFWSQFWNTITSFFS